MSRLGTEIAKSREAAGMSQKQLAKKLGVSESFISEVETGTRVMNDALLGRMKKILTGLGGGLEETAMREEETRAAAGPARAQAAPKRQPLSTPAYAYVAEGPVQDVWQSALEGVVKDVPVLDVNLAGQAESRRLPLIDNKVEGHAKDKVFYLRVPDNDMIGFRLVRDDLAFCVSTREMEADGIYLVTIGDRRVIRQLKRSGVGQVSMASHDGTIRRETLMIRDIAIHARLLRLEVKL